MNKNVVVGVRRIEGRVISTMFDEMRSTFHGSLTGDNAEELLCTYEIQRWLEKSARRARDIYVPMAHLPALRSYFYDRSLETRLRGYAEGSAEERQAAGLLDAYLSADDVLRGDRLVFTRDPSCFFEDERGARVEVPPGADECTMQRDFVVGAVEHTLVVSLCRKTEGLDEEDVAWANILEGERLEVPTGSFPDRIDVWIDCGDGLWKRVRMHPQRSGKKGLLGEPCFETTRYGERPRDGAEVHFHCGGELVFQLPLMCLFVAGEGQAEVRGLHLARGRKTDGPWRLNVARYLAAEWLWAWPKRLTVRCNDRWLPLLRAALRGHPHVKFVWEADHEVVCEAGDRWCQRSVDEQRVACVSEGCAEKRVLRVDEQATLLKRPRC